MWCMNESAGRLSLLAGISEVWLLVAKKYSVGILGPLFQYRMNCAILFINPMWEWLNVLCQRVSVLDGRTEARCVLCIWGEYAKRVECPLLDSIPYYIQALSTKRLNYSQVYNTKIVWIYENLKENATQNIFHSLQINEDLDNVRKSSTILLMKQIKSLWVISINTSTPVTLNWQQYASEFKAEEKMKERIRKIFWWQPPSEWICWQSSCLFPPTYQ